MVKEKHRNFYTHKDNYRRGGMRFCTLLNKFCQKEEIDWQEVLENFLSSQEGENMNGINNPLGAISALAGLAQSKNDPMAALSLLSNLGGAGAGSGNNSGANNGDKNASSSGSSASGANTADLLKLLSTLKPPQNNFSQQNNNQNHNAAQAGQNGKQNFHEQRQSDFSENKNHQQNAPNHNGRRYYRNKNKPKSDLKEKAEQLYRQEPKTDCDHCSANCPKSFRNYPSWEKINEAAAPWHLKK